MVSVERLSDATFLKRQARGSFELIAFRFAVHAWKDWLMTAEAYSVRRATDEDLLAAARLVHLEPGLREDELTAEQRATWAQMMAVADQTLYLASDTEAPVGYTASLKMHHLTYSCRPTLFIESMHVVAAHRRRGVARLMLQRVLQDARADGCHKVQLLTNKSHATDGAHDLYRSVGFEPEAEGFRLYLDPAA